MSDQTNEVTMCFLGIEEPCVIIYEIGAAPLRVFPVRLMNTALDGNSRSGGAFGTSHGRYLILRIKRDERRGVAMVRLCLVEILKPFLQLAMFADLKWRQPAAGFAHL